MSASREEFLNAMNHELNTQLQELDVVALTHNLPEHGLKQGDRGAIIHIYPNGQTFEVEFVNPDGTTQALLTLTAAHLQKMASFQLTLHPAFTTMPDQPKVQMNFHAPVHSAAGNVEGDMIVHAPAPNTTEATQQLTKLVEKLREKYPDKTDSEIFDILLNGFITMPQTNPQNWQRWQDLFSVFFAGSVEATKFLVPIAGIPIEVLKQLYTIYDRNRKQLPGT